MPSEILNYIPPQYHYRYSIWILVLQVAAFVVVGLGICFGLFGIWTLALAPVVIAAALGYLAWVRLKGTWECRIEGDVLSFHQPIDDGWTRVSITDLQQVLELFDTRSDASPGYELVLRDGRRLRMDRRLIGHFADFKRAVRLTNGSVEFGKRDGGLCHACGADLRVRRDRCPECGTAISTAAKA